MADASTGSCPRGQSKTFDKLILKMVKEEYPETKALSQVNGVDPLTALTLADKHRFMRSRDVGCYLGLRPEQSQSGEPDPQLGINKAGNSYLRTLLTEYANYIIGCSARIGHYNVEVGS